MIRQSLLLPARALRTPLHSHISTASRLSRPSTLRILRPSPFQSLASRSYSEASDTNPAAANGTEKGAPAAEAEDPVQKELQTAKREIIDLKDKYLRSVADFRNLQDRTKRDVSSARDFAISKFAKDLIDSIDNLDRALSTVPANKLIPSSNSSSPTSSAGQSSEQSASNGNEENSNTDLINLHDGLKMTEKILMQTLEKHGLIRFDPSDKREKFDPNLHEASFMAPQAGKEDGTVFATVQKGFLLNGRVVRAAKVGVVKNA